MNSFLLIGLILTGMLGITVINFFTGRKIKGRFISTEIPVSFNLFRVSHLLTLSILMEKIAIPFNDLSTILHDSFQGWDLWLKLGIYFSLFFAIVLLIYMVISWLCAVSFSIITNGRRPIDDAIEGNVSNIILFAGLQISFTIIVKSAVPDLLSLLISYPNLPVYH